MTLVTFLVLAALATKSATMQISGSLDVLPSVTKSETAMRIPALRGKQPTWENDHHKMAGMVVKRRTADKEADYEGEYAWNETELNCHNWLWHCQLRHSIHAVRYCPVDVQ
jgi:hypothetical protein